MTTPPPTVTPPAREVCRVTVEGPKGRVDLAMPVSTSIAELLPSLLAHVAPDTADRGTTPWVLQKLGDPPLDPDSTPETLGLRHGDVLHLRTEDDSLPELHFDDIADGVAHTLNRQPGRWSPDLTRRFTLTVASLTLVVLAITVFGAGPGPLTAATYAAIALVLGCGAVIGRRESIYGGAVLTAALAACSFAGAAGLALPRAADGGYAPGVAGLAFALSGIAVMAGVLLACGVLPLTVAGTLLTSTVVTAIGTTLFVTFDLAPAQTAGLVGVGMFVVGHFSSNLSLRLAQLRVPHLPHDAEELQEDIEPEPEERVAQRVTAATTYLNIISLTCAASYAVAFWLLADHPGWIGWVLPAVLSCAIVLHSRGQTGVLQRIPAVIVGWLAIALLLIERAAGTGLGGWSTTCVLLLLGSVLLLLGAWRLPTSRLRPLWGHIGDILELLSAIALLPLLLQLLHVYAYFRSLAG